ncbi:MAG: NirA family protein [Verrucomicrobiota bacterium]
MNIPNQTGFSREQKNYLEGFFSGVAQRAGSSFLGETADGRITNNAGESVTGNKLEEVYGVPIEDLCKEEKIKHEEHGLDVFDKIWEHAEQDKFPEGGDVFRWKFHGLFYVKPAQDSLMLRCRIAGCALLAHQMEGLAEIAEKWGGQYAHVTTRGNFQIREIMPKDSMKVLLHLADLGLTSKGSGADNLRNVTASPTAGFDPNEVYDVLPLARNMHTYILNTREMYDLPRKFNISFDGGGSISVCADTNDIGFLAVRVGEGHGVDPGVYFRVQLCGITGHRQFASDCGLLLRPDECVPVAAAMVRVFVEHGCRTNRKKARLKYLIDDWGVEKFLEETQKKLAFTMGCLPFDECEPRFEIVRHGYLGVHPQKQKGLNYIGVVVPVGFLTPEQMRGLAKISRRYGTGDIRLTVWQNVILPHISDADLETVKGEIKALQLEYTANFVTGGLVACTGNRGCRFSSADTKGHAMKISERLSGEISLDQPINIHLTGCPNSCAQHYIGDIGLVATPVKRDGESVEGYNMVIGGGVDNEQGIARELHNGIPGDELPDVIEYMLERYMAGRERGESFLEFVRRHDIEALKTLFFNHATV